MVVSDIVFNLFTCKYFCTNLIPSHLSSSGHSLPQNGMLPKGVTLSTSCVLSIPQLSEQHTHLAALKAVAPVSEEIGEKQGLGGKMEGDIPC